MHISEVIDLQLLERIMTDWSNATGMATIAVDHEGNYCSGEMLEKQEKASQWLLKR